MKTQNQIKQIQTVLTRRRGMSKPDCFPALCLTLLLALALSSQATITVTSTDDSGPGTLRAAIAAARWSGDTIDFNLTYPASITLTSGPLVVDKTYNTNLNIFGPGADLLTVSGNQTSRVFEIGRDTTVTLAGLTIANGRTVNDFGGGILNSYGILTIQNCTVSGNSADSDSPFGGYGNGGGIFNHYGTLTIRNSTISGNTASGHGGGIWAIGPVTLDFVTITANSAGILDGGTSFRDTSSTVHNTIIAGNSPRYQGDVRGTITSLGHNLIGDGTGSSGFGAVGDQVGTADSPIDPLLGPLADNGGPTRTHALLAGSPAIDNGEAVLGINTDQRGVYRPQLFVPDIGAYEFIDFDVAHTLLGAATSSRASQDSVNAVSNKLNTIETEILALNLSALDVPVSTRATPGDVLATQTALTTAINSRASQTSVNDLGTQVASRASQSSVDALQSGVTMVKGDTDMIKIDVGSVKALAVLNLDAAVSTRASQTSVNGLQADVRIVKTDVGEVKTDVGTVKTLAQVNLDAAVSTRASQTSVTALDTKLSGHITTYNADTDTSLRVVIERALVEGRRISLFYLPATKNGQIDFVKAIVLDTLNANLATGAINQQVFNAAMTAYNKAMGFLMATPPNYKKAYDQFVVAYQAVVAP